MKILDSIVLSIFGGIMLILTIGFLILFVEILIDKIKKKVRKWKNKRTAEK